MVRGSGGHRRQDDRRGSRGGDIAPVVRLVLDWDGTVTELDTLCEILDRYGNPDLTRRAQEAVGKTITLREEIELEFTGVQAPLDEVNEWLGGHISVRAGFRELVEALDPLILSSGFEETIRPLLEREGVQPRLLANRVEARPEGWNVLWRDPATCTECGEACKRRSLPEGPGDLVYVGDGYSDRCAALAADRVFAIDGLASYLEAQGVRYEPFTDLFDVLHVLEA